MPGAFRPEIDAGDALDLVLQLDPLGNYVAVAEPDRFLVGMVLGFAGFGRLHRPGPGQGHTAGSAQRPKIGLGDGWADVDTARSNPCRPRI